MSGIVRATVHHRQQNTTDVQRGVDGTLDLCHRVKQKVKTLCRQKAGLILFLNKTVYLFAWM